MFFIVRPAGLPAAMDDADPFVCEAAQDGLMSVAFVFLGSSPNLVAELG